MPKTYKLLQVENLNTSFRIDAGRVLAVNGVSFTLEPGEVLGIVGESGSGKSVTAYSIMGILDKNGKVDSGKIIYNGTDLLRISENEYRNIRGNRISIIFQDAMTSLNPTWTIGNQLREAILIHAKNPVEQAIYDLENAIKSDEQRIISLNKGIANHPEREYLKTDLAFVENKLEEDKKAYAEAKVKARSDYKALKKKKHQEFRDKRPQLNMGINAARHAYVRDFFKLAPLPPEEEALAQKEAHILSMDIKAKEEALAKQNEAYAKANEALQNASAEDKESLSLACRSEKRVLKNAEFDLKKAQKKLRKYVAKYRRDIRLAPRRERWQNYRKARKTKSDFYWDCVSAYRENRHSAHKKALQMLVEVGITEPEKRMKQYPFELSGGMLQRCMIAMALVERPDILIADEPTTALDVTIQAQILDLLKKLQAEYGMAIIIITHDLGVVAQICDKVDIMYAGRIVERGTVDEVFYNPQHEYTKGLLKSMPKLDQKGKLEPIQGNPVDLFCLPKGCAFSSRCKECMQICIDKYPEEVACSESGHAASCWKMIQRLHEEGKIDVTATPEGKPLVYNGAVIAEAKKRKGGKANG